MNLTARRAVEALRAGVPNRDAVRDLGTDQKLIQDRFVGALSQVEVETSAGRQIPGLLVGGDFGTGKSHLLEWLQHLALEQRFACSKVVISKEAPLGDPHKVFKAAIQSLRLPDITGGLEEVVHKLNPESADFGSMYKAVQEPKSGFEPLFRATLELFKRTKHRELEERLVSFWGGDRIKVADVKRALREVGAAPETLKGRKQAELAYPRFRFIAQLLAGAGYAGWVILLDEVELIASFPLQGRARSYGTLAMLLGELPDEQLPGVYVVAAVSNDLDPIVFEERRDHEVVPQKMGDRYPSLVAPAEAGMNVLRAAKRRLDLEPQGADALVATHARVRELYTKAFDWSPADGAPDVKERSRRMREYVRSWITGWDLKRLDPSYSPDIQTETFVPNFDERPELEQSSEPDEPDDA